MGWFSNLRMRNKLLFAIGIVLLLSGALGGAALRSLSQIGQAYDDVTDNSMPSIQALADMEITLRDGRILWLSSFIAKDDREVEENARNAVALRKTLEERARKYEGLVADDGERRLYEDFRKSLDVYLGGQAQIADYIRNKQMNEARDLINGLQKQRLADTSDRLTALTDYNKASADKAVDRANGVEVTARTTVIGGVGLALLVGFGFAFVIAARMAAPLAKMSQTMERAAEGDLTARAEVESADEIGHMAVTLNAFLKRLHDSIAEVAQTSRHVASASDELSSGAQQLASGSQEQASSLEETAASIEQMNGTIAQNATSAEQARDLATGSSESADRGASVVGDAVQAMERISEASKKIGEIIGVIDEIAFQTNLLALNAAVEAARAGDQGRGFAVVASEVRTLAQRSATAAKEIKTLIQDSLSCVEDGSRLVHASGETLHEIVASVKRVTDLTVQIATAGREQASGIEQINGAVGQMDRVVQSNSAQTEELSATAEELASQAESLRRLVERFKIDSSYSGGALAERAPSDRGLASLPPAKQRTRPGRLQSPSPARPTPRAPAARPSPKPSQRPTTDQLADF